jgi:hypothetical protein
MTALVLALLLSASDSLGAVKVGELSIRLPRESKDWKWTDADDANGKGKSLQSADGEGQIELNVYPVDPVRPAKECIEQLVKALPDGAGYEATMVGASPAYKKIAQDYVGEGEAAKKESNRVNTVSYVGCDGKIKWIMSMTSKSSKASRFGPLLKKIVESIGYPK